MLFNDRFETLDEGIESLAGIGFLGPEGIADLLLRKTVVLGSKEHAEELLLHGGEVNELTLRGVETIIGGENQIAHARYDIFHAATEIVDGEGCPSHRQEEQGERPLLVRVTPDGEERERRIATELALGLSVTPGKTIAAQTGMTVILFQGII